MPGATLDEAVDDDNWKATMAVKLGPISLSFKTDVKREASDEAARQAKLSARAREARGKGNASATIESSLTPQNGGTKVDIVTDLQLTGPVAQYGRGLVQDVSSQLVGQFADCLKKQLGAATPEEAAAAVAVQSRPVGGLRLGLGALWRSFTRLFRRG
jgi:carbon monoxide dehydrogenase subunit G